MDDIAHISHVELLTPKPAETLRFFADILGMEQVAEHDGSAFLHGYGDYQRCSLVVTGSDAAGVGHVALRARSPEALARRVEALERAEAQGGWVDGDFGHGRAYRFRDPEGHLFELFHDVERQETPPGVAKNRYGRRGAAGVGVKRVDHVNLLAKDVAANRSFAERELGYRLLDSVLGQDGSEEAAFMTLSIAPVELVYVREVTERAARLHHLAFWVDTREEVLRAADVLIDHEIPIEAGPSLHTVGSSFFLYTLEPGGNRIEVTTGADFVLDPDGPPRVWTAEERSRGIGWGTKFPDSWRTYGTPA